MMRSRPIERDSADKLHILTKITAAGKIKNRVDVDNVTITFTTRPSCGGDPPDKENRSGLPSQLQPSGGEHRWGRSLLIGSVEFADTYTGGERGPQCAVSTTRRRSPPGVA